MNDNNNFKIDKYNYLNREASGIKVIPVRLERERV